MHLLTFLRENRRWLAGAYLLTLFASFGQTYFISLSSGHIRAEYQLTHGQFGLMFTASQFLTGLGLLAIGPMVDRHRARTMAIAVVGTAVVGCFGMAWSTNAALLMLVLFVLRISGPGMMSHLSFTTMGRWFAAQRGRAVAVSALGINTGEALLPFAFVKLSETIGWRASWIVAGVATLVIALPAIATLYSVERKPRQTDTVASRVAPRQWTQREAITTWNFYSLMIGVALPGFTTFTIFFNQVHLVEMKGWSMETFALSFALMATSTFTLVIVSGLLIDRFSALAQLPLFLLPMAVGAIILALANDQRLTFLVMLLFGITLGFAWTLFGALWAEVYGTLHLGAIRSVVAGLTALFVSLGPAATGLLIDGGVELPVQIFFMGCMCCVMAVVLFFTVRSVRAGEREALSDAQ